MYMVMLLATRTPWTVLTKSVPVAPAVGDWLLGCGPQSDQQCLVQPAVTDLVCAPFVDTASVESFAGQGLIGVTKLNRY